MKIKKGKNLVMQGVQGGLGGQIVARQGRNGDTIYSTPPVRTAPFSANQLAVQQTMALAVNWGKNQKNNPAYQSVDHPDGGKYASPYHAAVADYRRPPQGAVGRLYVDGAPYDGTNSPDDSSTTVKVYFEIEAITTMETISIAKGYRNADGTNRIATASGVALTLEALPDDPTKELFVYDLKAALAATTGGAVTFASISAKEIYFQLDAYNLPGRSSVLSALDAGTTTTLHGGGTPDLIVEEISGLVVSWN